VGGIRIYRVNEPPEKKPPRHIFSTARTDKPKYDPDLHQIWICSMRMDMSKHYHPEFTVEVANFMFDQYLMDLSDVFEDWCNQTFGRPR